MFELENGGANWRQGKDTISKKKGRNQRRRCRLKGLGIGRFSDALGGETNYRLGRGWREKRWARGEGGGGDHRNSKKEKGKHTRWRTKYGELRPGGTVYYIFTVYEYGPNAPLNDRNNEKRVLEQARRALAFLPSDLWPAARTSPSRLNRNEHLSLQRHSLGGLERIKTSGKGGGRPSRALHITQHAFDRLDQPHIFLEIEGQCVRVDLPYGQTMDTGIFVHSSGKFYEKMYERSSLCILSLSRFCCSSLALLGPPFHGHLSPKNARGEGPRHSSQSLTWCEGKQKRNEQRRKNRKADENKMAWQIYQKWKQIRPSADMSAQVH